MTIAIKKYDKLKILNKFDEIKTLIIYKNKNKNNFIKLRWLFSSEEMIDITNLSSEEMDNIIGIDSSQHIYDIGENNVEEPIEYLNLVENLEYTFINDSIFRFDEEF